MKTIMDNNAKLRKKNVYKEKSHNIDQIKKE